MTRMQLVRTLAAWRPDLTAYRDVELPIGSPSNRSPRYLDLHDEIADLDAMIGAIVDELAPDLVARNSIGHIGAAQLLLAAGDNPDRSGPKPASPRSVIQSCSRLLGKTIRHRLNRAAIGMPTAPCISSQSAAYDRSENQGLRGQTRAEGHSKLDAIRALKRYIAREVFTIIIAAPKT